MHACLKGGPMPIWLGGGELHAADMRATCVLMTAESTEELHTFFAAEAQQPRVTELKAGNNAHWI